MAKVLFWSFSFNISPSNEYLGLISFRIDCFDLLAGQGTLELLLQHHSLKASILWHSAFFMVQLSHPYMTTGKTTALTIGTFVRKVMSLLFSMLSRLVIAFLTRSKHLLISRLQSPSAVILEPPKIKSVTVSIVCSSSSICHEVMGVCVSEWKLFSHVWLYDPLDYAVHGILQARILEWVAFPFSRESSQPRGQTQVSHIAGKFLTSWATRETQEYWSG